MATKFKEGISVHVVVAAKGDYSERHVWNVRAFFEEADAQKFIGEQEERDIIEFVVNQKKVDIYYELLSKWKEENPYPVYAGPIKPKLDQENPNKKQAQALHIENLAEWNEVSRPLKDKFKVDEEIWRRKEKEKSKELEAMALEQVMRMTVVVSPDIADKLGYDKIKYHIEEISIYSRNIN
jgi:hypothetical protein